ncbi:MAG: E2 ligase fold family C protein [Chloroflexota bacterium]|nr:E2 ligase fold family C protein [Chloroflexota bacterium]
MALANFFDKAAVAAAQALQGVDYASLAASLEAQVVGLAFDDLAVTRPEGKLTLELAVNLLARLYPRLAFIPDGAHAEAAVESLIAIAHSINPEIEVRANAATVAAVLAVGETAAKTTAPVVYMGSEGWVARISSGGPVGSGDSLNPFGAGAAACFGAANVFRQLFGSHLQGGDVDDFFSFSLLDYDPQSAEPYNPPLRPVALGESYLVGLGAVGNGAVWALARTPGLTGTLHLIDHETVELSNLQRYVLTTQADVEEPKALLAARQFAGTGVKALPHQQKWGEYLRHVSAWKFERVAVAVDNAEDRQAVQGALPKWVVNAWTQPGDLGVSRHSFLGDEACLTCLYFPDEMGQHLDRIIASAIGLPEAYMEVRALLHTNGPVGRDLLARAADAMRVPLEPLLPFESEPIRVFYARAVCGGAVLRLGGTVGGNHRAAAVPLAFQSALAGIMLAAELIAHTGGLRPADFPVTTKIDLLRPLGSHLSLHIRKHRSGFCICQDSDYIKAYREKYEVG